MVSASAHAGEWQGSERASGVDAVSPYASYVVETFLTLGAVSVLAFVLLYGARRAGLGRATGSIRLVGRLPVDARRSVLLVRVAEQVFVVGVSEAGFTKLGELAASEVPDPPASPPARSFAATLAALRRGAP